jgi:hypothetical protein
VEANGSVPRCPKSGAVLEVLVKSLRLHLPAVGGKAADLLGGRTARRYCAGGEVSEQARRDLCLSAANAAGDAGYLDGFELPVQGPTEPPRNTYLAGVLSDWLGAWDSTYGAFAAARGALSADAAFAIARPAALDFGLPVAALMNLCGVRESAECMGAGDDVIAVAPGETPLRSLLKYLQDPSVARLPRLELDTETDPEHPVATWVIPKPRPQLEPEQLADELGLDETTVQKWGREEHLPSPKNVERLVVHFAGPGAGAAKLRRWLRVQLALVDVGRRLAAALGHPRAREVMAAFVQVACLPPDLFKYGVPHDVFLAGQRDMLERGAASPAGRRALEMFELGMPLMDIPPTPLKPERWLDDVRAVRAGTVNERLVAALG